MYIKGVNKDLSPKHSNFKFTIGGTFESEKGYFFCDNAVNIMEYFDNPRKIKFLEIKPEAEIEIPYSFEKGTYKCKKITIIREIPHREIKETDYNVHTRLDTFSTI